MFKSLSLHFYNMTKYTTIIRNHQYTQYNEKRKKEEIKKIKILVIIFSNTYYLKEKFKKFFFKIQINNTKTI